MADWPEPPIVPQDFDHFQSHVSENPAPWFEYLQLCHDVVERLSAENATLRQTVQDAEKQLASKANQMEYQREEYDRLADRLQSKLITAEAEKLNALAAAAPVVGTPETTPLPNESAENAPAHATRAPTAPATAPREPLRLSERIPDPDKFLGDSKDLNRFVSQVYQKLTVNRDRFRTPQERMTYVTSRLSGTAYAQIAPHITLGNHDFTDFEEILRLLETAFGDPDRVQNAQNELFRLHQAHADFSSFHAEFERLSLEGELPEIARAPLLMQNISRELHEMLLHTPSPSKEYRPLVRHLQELDNRRRQYRQRTQFPQARISQRATPLTALPPQSVHPVSPGPHERKREIRIPTTPLPGSGDPMDLSMVRRHSRSDRETGACFRCHKTGHRVRDCQLPDTRPQDVQKRDVLARELRSLELRLEHPYARANTISRSPSPPSPRKSVRDRSASPTSYSENGVSLAEVVSRR